MINIKIFFLALFALLLTSCTYHIKRDLVSAIGQDIEMHEMYYGKPEKVTTLDILTTREYMLKETECVYEIDVNNKNIITDYRFISNEKICVLPLNWGGPW